MFVERPIPGDHVEDTARELRSVEHLLMVLDHVLFANVLLRAHTVGTLKSYLKLSRTLPEEKLNKTLRFW